MIKKRNKVKFGNFFVKLNEYWKVLKVLSSYNLWGKNKFKDSYLRTPLMKFLKKMCSSKNNCLYVICV